VGSPARPAVRDFRFAVAWWPDSQSAGAGAGLRKRPQSDARVSAGRSVSSRKGPSRRETTAAVGNPLLGASDRVNPDGTTITLTNPEKPAMTHRITMLSSLSSLFSAAVATLALTACGAAEDAPTTAQSTTSITAPNSAGPGPSEAAPTPGHRGRGRSPQDLVARFDQNGDGQLQVSELPERAKARLGKADADGNGVITVEELGQHKQQRQAERFAKSDANGDGKLTESEVGAPRWSRMSVADADGDGAVTAEELQQAHQQGKLGPRGSGKGRHGGRGGKGAKGGPGRPGGHLFERADKDGDGKLTQSEVPEQVWNHIRVADADGDGAVTQAEMQAARDNGTLKPPPRPGFGQGAKGGKGRPGGRGRPASGPAQN